MDNQNVKPILSVFDFDGTLTYRDSFTLFLRAELGAARYLSEMTRLAMPAACFVFGLKTRDELKELLIRRFLSTITVESVKEMADDFCERYWQKLMRPNGLEEVAEQLRQGAKVTLCSASPELILKPFAKRLGIDLIATRLEERNGVLTGKIDGFNCRQAEKVRRLALDHGELSAFHVRAWGDSAGDKQLLECAAEPYFRKFH